jgi:hypothetical protein
VSDPLRHHHDGGGIALGDLSDVRSVRPGRDQRVAFGRLGPVEERDGKFILQERRRRCRAARPVWIGQVLATADRS